MHQIALPFIANHIFNVKTTNSSTVSPGVSHLLTKIASKSAPAQPEETLAEEEEMEFDIGEKEDNKDVVKRSMKGVNKGMKSLANMSTNMSSYMTNLIGKKR